MAAGRDSKKKKEKKKTDTPLAMGVINDFTDSFGIIMKLLRPHQSGKFFDDCELRESRFHRFKTACNKDFGLFLAVCHASNNIPSIQSINSVEKVIQSLPEKYQCIHHEFLSRPSCPYSPRGPYGRVINLCKEAFTDFPKCDG